MLLLAVALAHVTGRGSGAALPWDKMDQLKPPSSLLLSGNLAENWRRWEQRFKLYMTASGANEKDEEVKVAILLHTIGEDALDLFNTFTFADDEDGTVDGILKAFEAYCSPEKNVVFERYQFWSHAMADGLPVDKFVTELRQKSKSCEFGISETDMIRDKLVFSLNNAALKERLLREKDLNLAKAVTLCRASEAARSQMQAMQTTHAVGESHVQAMNRAPAQPQTEKGKFYSDRKKSKEWNAYCNKCGRTHEPRQCPAYGAVCHKCNKRNHFAKMCAKPADRMGTSNYSTVSRRGVHDLETEETEVDVDSLFIGTVACVEVNAVTKNKDTAWYTMARVMNVPVKFKIDTGADGNVLPLSIVESLPGHIQLQPTRTVLVAYGGTRLKPEGTVSLVCETAKAKANLEFYVINQSAVPIMGREASEELRLVKRIDAIEKRPVCKEELRRTPATKEELLEMYPSVFTGLGEFPGVHHIHTDPTVTPVVHGCRKIPLAVMDRLKASLRHLVDADVITPVNDPTEWVSSLVVTEKKNGSLRVCLDPRDLNKAIKRQHYSIPTPEDVRCKLAGKSIFTILDEKDGYWQVKLDEPSSELCTFNTPWGRYRFKRLPFGIKSASEVFQQKNCETFGNIEGVHIIADDMIIAASSDGEHAEILRQVMERAQAANVKFNKDKIQFKVNTVKYMGHIITSEGVKPDDAKVTAIANMPAPEDKHGVQRLLGMTRYLAQYIPGEATITAPLRQLLKKDAAWQWAHEHDAALESLKNALIRAPSLKFYDQHKPLTIQADASKDGLGACLLQDGCPLSYASRALSGTEQNYAQIEKELLAIVFAAKRFHQYIYGKTVTVQSDHKPLEVIFKKHLSKSPARLQRMLLQLQCYDLDIAYTPGKDMHVADTLSRAVVKGRVDDLTENLFEEKVVYGIEATDALSENMLKQLQEATAADKVLQAVIQAHQEGWPERRHRCDGSLHQYWPMRHTVGIRDGAVMTADKIIIPQSMRAVIMDKLHLAHQGIQRMKAHARMVLYWPGMAQDIEKKVEMCGTCQQMQPQNQREPLQSHEIPDLPWLKLGTDIFELHGQSYLVIVDYLTKYPEVLNLPDKTAHSVIQKMKSVFARHGIPKEVVSDHVPFASYEMQKFAAEWGIKLTHSSPGFPQSNGLAEITVKTVKRALKKAATTGTDPHLVLLSLRNTPVTGLDVSPAQMLMGRVLRSSLPCTSTVLEPSTPRDIHDRLKCLQTRREQYYNVGTKPLPELSPGTAVHMKTRHGWKPAVVLSKRVEPRSYSVESPAGVIFRRNRRHLRTIHPSLLGDADPADICQPDGETLRDEPTDPEVLQQNQAGAGDSPTRRTRSGRAVIPPIRYRDYVMSQH